MLWPDYLIVLLFVVIVALVIYVARQQARKVMRKGPVAREAEALEQIAEELKRTNALLERLAGNRNATGKQDKTS